MREVRARAEQDERYPAHVRVIWPWLCPDCDWRGIDCRVLAVRAAGEEASATQADRGVAAGGARRRLPRMPIAVRLANQGHWPSS